MTRSTNRRHWAEPEVYFRIVHTALDLGNGKAAYREQTVEVSLGPDGAFKNGNIGKITRLVPAQQVFRTVPAPRGKPRPPKEPRTPRIVDLLRKAQEWSRMIDSGEISGQADIARREGLTRARVTQVLALLRLAPAIQRHILSLPKTDRRPVITERALRPIARLDDHEEQRAAFSMLLDFELSSDGVLEPR